jgi:hypothetical protein
MEAEYERFMQEPVANYFLEGSPVCMRFYHRRSK